MNLHNWFLQLKAIYNFISIYLLVYWLLESIVYFIWTNDYYNWFLQLVSTIGFSHWFQKCNIVTDGFVDLFTSICLFNLLDIGDWITMRGGLIQPIYMPVIANKMCENEPPKLNEALHYLSSSTASILFLYQSSLSLLHHTFLVFSRMDLTVLSIFQKTVTFHHNLTPFT